MSPFLKEEDLEQYAIGLFSGNGYAHVNGPDIAPGEAHSERERFRDVVLVERLRKSLRRLNGHLASEIIDDAVRKVTTHETIDLVLNNKRFHALLIEGIPVEYRDPSGSIRYDRARIIDFDDVNNNDWLTVNQMTIKEDANERRPDVVVFVNGLPLGLIEFKNPADERATIRSAYAQLQTYKDELPGLLAYNEVLVITDGTRAAVGALTAEFERFSTWKREDGTTTDVEIALLINEFFDKGRFLDIIRYFTLFEVTGPRVIKKMASYHQYYAVNKAVERTVMASKIGGDGRIGVFWHTQGSGKSLSMTFYAGKIAQEPLMENPTIVAITDRNDLDGQLFDQFAACAQFLRQMPEQVDSREDLREKLQVAAGHIVFATIQKFYPSEGEVRYPVLTSRRNVVVMADEAHRSQYGLSGKMSDETGDIRYGFARHLRDALPNASRIGFTGTPIEKVDQNTRSIFGDYIDIYDIRRAIDDKATVPIYYEARIAKLKLRPEEVPHLDEAFEDITEGQEDDEKRKQASRWTQIEALVGAEHRIDEIAADLVTHFEKRREAFSFDGKALVVSMSRRICVALYAAIVRLRPEWHSDDDTKGAIKVVMTGSASDPVDWQRHIRNKQKRRGIESRFKDAADPLCLVIVRDMWLTGFDVPSMHTMYVDKPMRGHSLMQAIARVNRVFRDKPGGLVVDYIGIATELKYALAVYIDSGGEGEPVLNEEDAVAALQREYEIIRGIFHLFPYQQYLEGDTGRKMLGLNRAADFVLGLKDGKDRYLYAVRRLADANALASTSDYARAISDEVAFFRGVRATLVKASPAGVQDLEDVALAMQQLVSAAVSSDGVIDVLRQAGIKQPDISVFSDEFLLEIQGLEQRNLAKERGRPDLRG